ncbi:Uncharacterised protein [BD1-7 clade bacterium]|uniref:Uncharacterized protein n=1 Tax=BD1-7 clade bacterium TaxID=2029982 RepID=A0A5S9QJ76_9GAMM|nr:Uncharacterised protein [BD1-7 clade bacterium]
MDIYLDQNIWIDLAKIYHGKDERPEAVELLELVQSKITSKAVRFPLSSVHYIETATISNPGRRERLGQVMFDLSRGETMAYYRRIVIGELEKALSVHFDIAPREYELFGYGYSHAFPIDFPRGIPDTIRPLLERSCLTGEKVFGQGMGGHNSKEQDKKFNNHIKELYRVKTELPKSQWDDALYAMALMDIQDPLNEVLQFWNIDFSEFESLGKNVLSSILDDMPSRALEVHLHRLVLANDNYNPKITDLNDWGGFALGAMYCDHAIGEKHMVDMLTRKKFKSKANIHKNVFDLGTVLENA